MSRRLPGHRPNMAGGGHGRDAGSSATDGIGHPITPLNVEKLQRSDDHECQEKLRLLQRELVRKERLAALGQLVGTVSHELRNPLGTIQNSICTLKNTITSPTEISERALSRIERNVARCEKLIRELLELVREPELDPERTEIDAFVDQVMSEQELPTSIAVELALFSRVHMDVDRDRFRRALVNVLANAREAMVGNSTDERPGRLEVETARREDRLEIRVSDTGRGISSDELTSVFEPLYTTKSFGVGLGLPIVKRAMERHDGGVEVRSTLGRRTTVTLWLPITPQ